MELCLIILCFFLPQFVSFSLFDFSQLKVISLLSYQLSIQNGPGNNFSSESEGHSQILKTCV